MAAIDLCTLDDVRTALEVTASDTSRDGLFATVITAASRAIMADADREFAPAATATRRFRWQGMRFMSLAPYDLRTVTTFTLNPESTSPTTLTSPTHYLLGPTVSQYGVYQSVEFAITLMPSRYSQTSRDYGFNFVDIAGGWGFAAPLPEDVVQACITTCTSWLRRDTSAFAMRDPEDVRMLAGDPMQTFTIPPAAKRLLHPYRRSVAL